MRVASVVSKTAPSETVDWEPLSINFDTSPEAFAREAGVVRQRLRELQEKHESGELFRDTSPRTHKMVAAFTFAAMVFFVSINASPVLEDLSRRVLLYSKDEPLVFAGGIFALFSLYSVSHRFYRTRRINSIYLSRMEALKNYLKVLDRLSIRGQND